MKKGFTLIEVISTIVIIGVLALIVTPISINILDKSRQKAYEAIVANILESANNYSVNNELGYNQLYKPINLETIQNAGYLEEKEVIDPRNNKKMNGCVFYKWVTNKNQYNFIYREDCSQESVYPDILIDVINDNNKEWMQEYLKFDIQGSEYDNYKYCVGQNECESTNKYNDTTTLFDVGENIVICATGYIGDEKGKSTCTKLYNVDPENPEITVNSISSSSNKIVVSASCEDTISGVKSIEYSVDNGNYQSSNVFSNLSVGVHKVNIRCIDNALNETTIEKSKTILDKPTITQASQTPSGTYAQKRVIRITYSTSDEQGIYNYFKSTVSASVGSGVVVQSCGTGTNPGSCSTSSITTLTANTWYKTNSKTVDITYTSNGSLYAQSKDDDGTKEDASTYAIVNIDNISPEITVNSITTSSKSIVVNASCEDSLSGVKSIEYSIDNGNYQSNNVFSNLSVGVHKINIKCTDNALNETTIEKSKAILDKPTIAQTSQTPSGTYAQKRVIRITYPTGDGVYNYFKSTVSASVGSGVVVQSCGTSTNPGSCSTSSVTTLAANTWYRTNSKTVDITYTSNGYLYAQSKADDGTKEDASTYGIVNIDTSKPTVSITSVTVSTNTAKVQASCSDSESGIVKYEFSSNNGSTWVSNGTTNSYTFTGLSTGANSTFKVRCTNGSALTNEAYKVSYIPASRKFSYSNETYSSHTYTVNMTGYTKISWSASMRREDDNDCDDGYNGEEAGLFVTIKNSSGTVVKSFTLDDAWTGSGNDCCSDCDEYFSGSINISSYGFSGNYNVEISISGHIYNGYILFE
jgi:prepilin-type N-terminal cleavage/methylation domain-containing protein